MIGSDETAGPARTGYHHGDLRSGLLAAAEEELRENGPEGFSLRGCARRAGVSHAAPKHHFGSVDGLLDALATLGFRRLSAAMEERIRDTPPPEQLVASGVGYVAFARDNPALFKLMFSSRRRSDEPSPQALEAGRAAFDILRVNADAAAPGRAPGEAALDIAASWSIVHGLAHLIIEESAALQGLLGEASEQAIRSVLMRPLPVKEG